MAIKRKKYKSLIAKTLVFSVLAFSMIPSFRGNTYAEGNDANKIETIDINKKINLTNMNYYNIIVLGGLDEKGNQIPKSKICNIMNSKIEGAFAVNGDINILNGEWGNPEVGAFLSQGAEADKNNMTRDGDYKTNNAVLLLSGKVTVASRCAKKLNVWSNSGFPIVTENYNSDKKFGTVLEGQTKNYIAIKSKEDIDSAFESLKSTAENFANTCGSLNESNLQNTNTNFTYYVKGHWNETFSEPISLLSGTKDVLVIKLPESTDRNDFRISGGTFPDTINIDGKSKKLTDFKKVIFVSNSNKVYFDGGQWNYKEKLFQVKKENSEVCKELGSRIMWVFPNATQVEKSGLDIAGSLIAPKANFISHGSNNVGQIVVKCFNQDKGGEFYALAEYPSLSIKVKDKVILYGDKVNLSNLIGTISSTGTSTYKYTINKEGSTDIIDNGSFSTSALNNQNKLKDFYVNPKDSGTYEIKITGNGFEKKVKSKIIVLKPQIKINKALNNNKDESSAYSMIEKIFSNDGGKTISSEKGKIFSFNLKEKYSLKDGDKGYVPVFINNQEWNADVKADDKTGVTLKNITRGTYTLSERETGGYKYTSATLNRKDFNANGGTFNIGLSENDKVTLNGVELEGENPIIPIIVTNIKKNENLFHSNDVIRNQF